MSNLEVMSSRSRHVMLSAMRPALPTMPSSKAARIVIRLVQAVMLAYGAREAFRFMHDRRS